MALSRKKYLYIILFLVSPVTLSLYAQNSVQKPTISIDLNSNTTACDNQNKDTADDIIISKLDHNSNQFIVGLSIPKDSLVMATKTKDQTSSTCEENSFIAGSFSILAKDIIENYKYDFSETFIDILFFENIDLARTRTI